MTPLLLVSLVLLAQKPALTGKVREAAVECFTLGRSESPGYRAACLDAERLLRPLAEKGDVSAQALLGNILVTMLHAPQPGVAWIRAAAEKNSAPAQFLLALILRRGGHGVQRDYVEAYKWAILAGEEEDADELRQEIESALNDEQEFQALRMVREWDLGRAEAPPENPYLPPRSLDEMKADCVGRIDEGGERTPQLLQRCGEAMRALYPMAARGELSAQDWLGVTLVALGREAEGAIWIRRAASQGVAEAQFHLALTVKEGVGLPKDAGEAYMWAVLAGDHPGAEELRSEIAAGLSGAEEAHARRLAHEWKPGTTLQKSSQSAPNLDGVYIGLWQSDRFSVQGTVRMVVETREGQPRFTAFVTGGRFKGGEMSLMSLEHAGGGLWEVRLESQKKKLIVTGTFHGRTFVGSYKYRRKLKRDDVGQWTLFKER